MPLPRRSLPPRSELLRALRRRTVPAWWRDAKLGIFVHWVPASVPGFAPTDVESADILTVDDPHPLSHVPYAEWYQSSLQFPDSPVARFHRETYGDRPYDAFADDFRAGLDQWDPDDWADRLARSGARYVVLVAKHMDGFCLWPSEVVNPHRPGWCTERDVVGELAAAVRARGLRFGLYYCGGLDSTFDDRGIGVPSDLLAAIPHDPAYGDYAEAQVRELIERYRPSVLWNDIGWPFGGERLWRLLTDYLEAVPDGVVNDRFQPRRGYVDLLEVAPFRRAFDAVARRALQNRTPAPAPPFFHHRTPEYMTFDLPPSVAWEVCRGMDRSFAYNRASQPEHFLSHPDLLGSFADIVARGGNLLLNVGPRGEDATIPDEQQQRLDWLGSWLATTGEAVFGSRRWVQDAMTTPDGHEVRFTASFDDVHVIVLDGPRHRLVVPNLAPGPTDDAVVLGDGRPLPWRRTEAGDLEVDIDLVPDDHPWPLVVTVRGARPSGSGDESRRILPARR